MQLRIVSSLAANWLQVDAVFEGRCFVYFRRIEIENIPADSLEDASQWCKDLFVEKVRLFWIDH